MKILQIFIIITLSFSFITAQYEIKNCTIVMLDDKLEIYKLETTKKQPDGSEYISIKYSKALPAGFKRQKESYKEFIARMAKKHTIFVAEVFLQGLIYYGLLKRIKWYDERTNSNAIHKLSLSQDQAKEKKLFATLDYSILELYISLDTIPRFYRFFHDIKNGRKDKVVRENS